MKKYFRYKHFIRKWKYPVLNKEYRVICKLVKSEVTKKEPKILYKYLNSQQVIKESIRALNKSDGELTEDRMELLNKNFQSVFVIEDEGILPSFEVKENLKAFVDLKPEDISYDLVSQKLKKLEENKAIEPDKLHQKLLKNCSKTFFFPITLIFQASLTDSELPIQFRSANVSPF